MRKTWIVGLVAVAALVAVTLPAEPPEGGMWEHFSRRFDENQDGQVTQEEFDRVANRFSRLDRNGDGVLTEDDFQGGAPHHGAMIVRLADADRNHEVSADEWQQFLAELDADADGVITDDELVAFFESRRPADAPRPHREHKPRAGNLLDQDGDGVLETADLDAIFAELDANGDQTLQSDEMPGFPGKGHHGFHRGFHGGGH